MSKSIGPGRLGNKFFRNYALHFLAQKHDLVCLYDNEQTFRKLGITFHHGSRRYPRTRYIKNDHFLSCLRSTRVQENFDLYHDFFQTLAISDMIFKTVREHANSIKEKNPFRDRYGTNRDIGIHLRLDDASAYAPSLEYYMSLLDHLSKNEIGTIYITTDEPEHTMVQCLLDRYERSMLYVGNEIETLQFFSTCKYLLLSQGTFSAMIGYLAFDSNEIYIPDKVIKFEWHPLEIFRNKNFKNGYEITTEEPNQGP
jgi:hypothetical protein